MVGVCEVDSFKSVMKDMWNVEGCDDAGNYMKFQFFIFLFQKGRTE
jgi:hypothetical protein